jgi:hypothetical protein
MRTYIEHFELNEHEEERRWRRMSMKRTKNVE